MNHLGTALRILRNTADAEDAVQEAELAAHKHGIQNTSTIVRNKAIDTLRYNRRHPSIPLDVAEEPTQTQTVEPDTEELSQAILSLPKPQQEAIILHFYQELHYHEIASILKIPLGTAKTRVHDGIKRLRSRFSHE